MRPTSFLVCCGLFLAALGAVRPAGAANVTAPFAGSYTLVDLGTPAGVAVRFGGLTLLPGAPNTLLIAGGANAAGGKLYTIGVTRDGSNHITGFSGTAVEYAAADNNDGGVVFGPGGVLFLTAYPTNKLYQYKPGSTAPDKITDLGPLGVASSVGAINFVPPGLPGAGQAKIVSYNASRWYTITLTPDGSGTYTVSNAVAGPTTQGGPEGFIYVPTGSPLFSVPTMLVSEYGSNLVAAFEVDANGDPKVVGAPNTARQVFVEGLTGAEGATIDPLTGDFLFSTFGGSNRVLAVRGFVPPSTTVPGSSTTTTTVTTTSTTTTTVPESCDSALPLADLTGLECAVTTMRSTVGAPPQPECTGTGKCNCTMRQSLDRIGTAIVNARSSATPKQCRRKIKDARRLADVLARHVRTSAKRNCLAGGARRDALLAQAKVLTSRARAVQKGPYCAAR